MMEDGYRAKRLGLARDAAESAAVVRPLRRDVGERRGVRGQGGGAVPRARGARQGAIKIKDLVLPKWFECLREVESDRVVKDII